MKLKNILFSLVLVTLLIVSTACGSDSEGKSVDAKSDEIYNIRLSHVVEVDHPFHVAAEEFKEEVEEKSDGLIEVEIFPSGQLYSSEREAVEAVQLNNVEMTRVAAPALAGFIPEFSVLSLPFLFDDLDDAHAALDGELGEHLTDLLYDNNLMAFGYGENGFRHMLTNNPIEKPEDFDGLNIRVIENKMFEDLFNSMGANASPLGYGETYTSIQQGVYDGMDGEVASAYTGSFYEVLDYFTLSGHSYTATVSLINQDFFDSLPEDLQSVLEDATYKLNERHRELNQEYENEWLAELEANMEVNELTLEQKEVFREKLQPIFDKYTEEIDDDLVELVTQSSD